MEENKNNNLDDFMEDFDDLVAQELDAVDSDVNTDTVKDSKTSRGKSRSRKKSSSTEVLDDTNINDVDAEEFDVSVYRPLTMSNWFTTFMFMNIPIFDIFYLLFLALFSKQALKKDFARAYLLYKVVFLAIGLTVVIILTYMGLGVLDNALQFMQEL